MDLWSNRENQLKRDKKRIKQCIKRRFLCLIWSNFIQYPLNTGYKAKVCDFFSCRVMPQCYFSSLESTSLLYVFEISFSYGLVKLYMYHSPFWTHTFVITLLKITFTSTIYFHNHFMSKLFFPFIYLFSKVTIFLFNVTLSHIIRCIVLFSLFLYHFFHFSLCLFHKTSMSYL